MQRILSPFSNLALIVSLGGAGCSSPFNPNPLPLDEPLPFDGGHRWLFDAGTDTNLQSDAQPFGRDVVSNLDVNGDRVGDSGLCHPDPCRSRIMIADRTSSALCLDFEEVHASAGLSDTSLTGVSIADYNGDGDLDVYVLTNSSNILFRNDRGRFVPAPTAGLNLSGMTRGASWNDYDGDGDLDVLVLQESGSHLYQNNGGVFSRLPDSLGIHNPEPGRVALWIGIDLLMGTENGTRYYRTLGSGRYEEVARMVGLDDPGEASAMTAEDYDADGFRDIYLANTTGRNRLFRARPDRTYESVELSTGVTVGDRQSTDAAWVRQSAESPPSLYVVNYERGNAFFTNRMGHFTDVSNSLGIHAPGNNTRVAWGDFVGNGSPLLFLGRWGQSNLLYIPNVEIGGVVSRYTEQSHVLGIDTSGQTIAATTFDYDNDHRLDLLVGMTTGIRLYHNISTHIRTCPEEER